MILNSNVMLLQVRFKSMISHVAGQSSFKNVYHQFDLHVVLQIKNN
jgi:hypothetical protein